MTKKLLILTVLKNHDMIKTFIFIFHRLLTESAFLITKEIYKYNTKHYVILGGNLSLL